MARLPDHLVLPTTPLAVPKSVIAGDRYRITVLTERLFRLEYSPSGVFEDRATQSVINRRFDPVPYHLARDGQRVEVRTESVQLDYDGGPFSAGGLFAHLAGGQGHRRTWRYGVDQVTEFGEPANLGGTARTLDTIDGACPLEPGVLSQAGSAVLDDSRTLALTEDGWVAQREPGTIDLYLFAHGDDYAAALADFYALTGPQPLLPRWAFGNWWSRYHPYSDGEYRELHERFAAERLPFSVAVIDMDWHLVDVPPEYGTGWTGYTWNRGLFPDPGGFLEWLHSRGLKVALNVHPADGIRAFEDCYPAMAEAMGIDPSTGRPVNFDISDPAFLTAYFDLVHHPLEAQGVDFWWLDWQQGTHTAVPGLDPLWMLNHFHYLDSGRDGGRPMTFSRYAGPGSHRYPIGFSGDTVNSWESLDFQPYFTATASNIGYGWWSHDIGGHMWGYRNEELVTRWFQLGTFSPLNRLHSTKNEFMGKEPWRFNPQARHVMDEFLRLRHRLVPYLYTMNERAARRGLPLVLPLYYEPGPLSEQLRSPNSYLFGSELLVAPITQPINPALAMAWVDTWLPEGVWYDTFTGLRYTGGRRVRLHRGLETQPVLARAGAIVPLTGPDDLGTGNPATLELRVYAGADGEFVLYEDDDAATPQEVRTRIEWRDADRTLIVHPAVGAHGVVPPTRTITVSITGLTGGQADGLPTRTDEVRGRLLIHLGEVTTAEGAKLRVTGAVSSDNRVLERAFALLQRAEIGYALKDQIWAVLNNHSDLARRLLELQSLRIDPAVSDALTEILGAELPTS